MFFWKKTMFLFWKKNVFFKTSKTFLCTKNLSKIFLIFLKKHFFSKKKKHCFFFQKNKILVYRDKKTIFLWKQSFLSKIKCPLNCLVQKRTLSTFPWNKHRCPDVPAARYVCGIPTWFLWFEIVMLWNFVSNLVFPIENFNNY